MALIKCPECGQEVSDKAAACPRCASPILGANVIKIRLNLPDRINGRAGRKAEVVSSGGEVLWNGSRGQIAKIESEREINAYVRMNTEIGGWFSSDTVTMVPGKKYALSFSPATFFHKAKITIMEVDYMDAD